MYNYLGFLCSLNLVHFCQQVIVLCWCASGSQQVYMIGDLPSSTFYTTYWGGWRSRCLHWSSPAVSHSCSPLRPPPWPGEAPGWGYWWCCQWSGTLAPFYTCSRRCCHSSSSPVHPLCRINLSHVNLNRMPHQKLHTSANWSMISFQAFNTITEDTIPEMGIETTLITK